MSQTAREISEHEELTRYFLGEMSEDDQTDFEVRYFADPQLFAELCAWRNDLIDKYVDGELSPSMRLRFEAAIENSWSMNERIRFTETLHEIIEARSTTVNSRRRRNYAEIWESLWSFARKYRRVISITVALLLLLAAGYLVVRSLRQKATEKISNTDIRTANEWVNSADARIDTRNLT